MRGHLAWRQPARGVGGRAASGADRGARGQSQVIDTFLRLLDLPNTRLGAATVLGLLFVPVEWVEPANVGIEAVTSIYVSMGITSAQHLPVATAGLKPAAPPPVYG